DRARPRVARARRGAHAREPRARRRGRPVKAAGRTQVGIVGAGPAGLLLGQLLTRAGIANVVLEQRSRAHVEARGRAGVLERTAVELLRDAGVHARLDREGIPHRGIGLAWGERRERIDFDVLTVGGSVTIYGQDKVVADLIDARAASGAPLLFEADATSI